MVNLLTSTGAVRVVVPDPASLTEMVPRSVTSSEPSPVTVSLPLPTVITSAPGPPATCAKTESSAGLDRSTRSDVVTRSSPAPESTQDLPSPVRMLSSPLPVRTTAVLVNGSVFPSATGGSAFVKLGDCPPVKLTVRLPP